ncbi:MAG: MBL fold metallo-hydrolase [Verrucomicrobiota bacterium]
MIVNAPKRIATDVAWHPVGLVNVYFIGRPGDKWVLVDTGTPGHAAEVRAAAEARFGKDRPDAIVLTHGHFDHSGNALELAKEWRVPIYAHHLELPYVTGRSPYPPQDPLIGGFLGLASMFMPTSGADLSERVEEIPDPPKLYEKVPSLVGWQWIHTPGHSPGHLSLFRESDATLLAGDALATESMESLRALIKKKPELSAGPIPFNCDWQATAKSVRRLSELQPRTIAAGHGIPISGGELAEQLSTFAESLMPPKRGRYAIEPARTDENGIVSIPRPAPFAWLRMALRAVAATAGTIGAVMGARWVLTRRHR